MTQSGSKPFSFPAYRRSHFRSQTYLALVRIFSHLPPTLDNDNGRMEQEKSEKGLEFSEFVGLASVDPKDPLPEKKIQKVHKTTEGVQDKGMESGTNDVVLHDIERINVGEYGSVLMPGNNEDKQIGSKRASHMPTNYVQSQVLHRALLEEEDKQDEGNSFASKQKVNISDEKKHGPSSEERKVKRKRKKQKNQAEKNKKHDVKRLKLSPVQKSKTSAYCRHYLVGRCHQGDKCQFSHNTVPLTKSTPCRYFARQSCVKGNNCPFDHELSKYSCDNFVSRGFCSRGDACLFSHQLPPKEDGLTPSGVYRPELNSPSLLGNRGCSSVQQIHFINSMGIHSHIDPENKVIVQKHVAPTHKGIRFINIEKSSLPRPSTTEQGLITPDKESLVHIGACSDQSAFVTHQTSGEILEKFPAVAPKGANFLCFSKGSMCSFESSISSPLNKENDIKVPQFVNFGLSNHAGSSLQKDDCNNCHPIYATIANPSMLLVSQFGLQRPS